MKDYWFNVGVSFSKHPDTCIGACVEDEVKAKVTEFSDENLEELLSEVEAKVRLAWSYMRDRTKPGPLDLERTP